MKQQYAGRGLAVLLVLLAIALLLVERLPPVIAILAVITLCVGANWHSVSQTVRSTPALWAVAALIIWMILSAFWSIAGLEGWTGGVRIAAMILAAAMLPVLAMSLPADVKNKTADWALVAAAIAVALLCVETLFDMPLLRTARFFFNHEIFTDLVPADPDKADGYTYYRTLYLANRLTHLSSIVAILMVPLAAVFWHRHRHLAIVAVVVAALVGFLLAPAQTPLLAVMLGAGAAGIACIPAIARSRWTAPLAASAIAAAVIASPWLAETIYGYVPQHAGGMDVSIFHRLAIWDHAAGLIADRPVVGYGIEAARIIGRSGANVAEDAQGFAVAFQALPLHPHNASIQIWLELGGVGALLFALFVYLMTIKVWFLSNDRLLRAGLVGGWVSALAVAHLSYGIWQYWWIATLGLVATMLALIVAPVSAETGGGE